MHVLVTGGAGFIGSHLCEWLIKDGSQVTVVDNLSTGNLNNIRHLLNHTKFQFVKDSVLNTETVHVLVDKCDLIIHLAAAVGVDLIVKRPVQTIETNIRGTEFVLEIANKFAKKVILASTSEIYGKNTEVPFSEDMDRIMGSTMFSRWSYATSKAIDEFLGLAYHREYGLPVVITRFFNTVGPRQTGQYGMVIPRFVEAALDDQPIIIYGSGKQSRCFGYIDDVINGIMALVQEPKAEGEVFNIGADEEITIEELAIKIKAMIGSRSEIKRIPYEEAYGMPFDDMLRRVPDLSRIKNLVGYSPRFTLDMTLQNIIAYYEEKVRSCRDTA